MESIPAPYSELYRVSGGKAAYYPNGGEFLKMNSNKRSLLEKETYRNYMLLMFRYGLREIWTDQHRLKLLVLYLLAALTFSIVRHCVQRAGYFRCSQPDRVHPLLPDPCVWRAGSAHHVGWDAIQGEKYPEQLAAHWAGQPCR